MITNQQFQVKPDSFKELSRLTMIRLMPFLVIVPLLLLSIKYVYNGLEVTDYISFPVAITITVFFIYRSFKKREHSFNSYLLTLDDTKITKVQLHTTTISIPYSEIKEIVKTSNGRLIVKGNSLANTITVPAQLEELEKLTALLHSIKAIRPESNILFFKTFRGSLALLSFITMITFYAAKTKILIEVSGIIFILILIFVFIEIQRSKSIDPNVKRFKSYYTVYESGGFIIGTNALS